MSGSAGVFTAAGRRARGYSLPLALALALILLAAALRFHRLGEQSLWYDEGVTYALSLRSLTEMIPRLQRDVHAPAYFALLGLWQDLTGTSEFALRALSALFSVSSVAWAYALGKRLLHPGAGLAAAALVALNSFSIYYAQEARMYAMLAAVAGASMWLFAGCWRSRSGRGAIGLGLLNALGLYTHIAYALVIVSQVGALAIAALSALLKEKSMSLAFTRLRRDLTWALAANAVALLLFAPWLPVSLRQVVTQPNLAAAAAPDQVLALILGHLAFGNTYETGSGIWILLACLLLFFGLLPAPGGRWWRWSALLPLIWALVSLAAYLYLELTDRYLRFLLPAQLAFALWLGRGAWVLASRPLRRAGSRLGILPKIAAGIGLGALLLAQAASLPRLYHAPEFQRDDMRALVRLIEAELGAEDALIVSAAGLEELLRYYYKADAPVYGLPRSADEQETRAQTLDIIAARDRLHVILYGETEQDPRRVLETTLNRKAFEISEAWFDDFRYLRYARPAALQDPVQIDRSFGADIRLRSFALSADAVAVGDLLQIQMRWTAERTPGRRYKVFLQLLDGEGALVAQRDSEPVGGSAPTSTWRPDAVILDNHALLIPADLPAGTYRLIAGLYDIDDPAARLPTEGESYVALAEIALR